MTVRKRPAGSLRTLGVVVAMTASVGVAVLGAQKPAALSDSAVIARERATWNALMRRDSTAAEALVGKDVPFVVLNTGVGHATSSSLLNRIARNCETRRSDLDSVRVDRASDATTLVTYRLTEDRTCGSNHINEVAHVMSVWVFRDNRWVGVAQAFGAPSAK